MRRRLVVLLGAAAVLAPALTQLPRAAADLPQGSTVYAEVTADEVVLGNALVERRWDRSGFATTALTDKRAHDGVQGALGPDFRLWIGRAELPSTVFDVTSVAVSELPGGLRASIELAAPGISATRVAEVYEGIAGFRTQTTVTPLTPLALRGATLDEATVGSEATATIHAFRAGADWREPDWAGPPLQIGDPHAGTWRDSRTGAPGEAIAGPGQWISTVSQTHSLFMAMERNDRPSSRAEYADGVTRLTVDYSRDVVGLGPFEEDAHIENPTPADGRHRVLQPGEPFALEAAFTGFGINADDEPWQFYKYLSHHRMAEYDNAVTFNSNGTDANVRSTGAKDDMDYATVLEVAPIAKRLGVETFILDDGWQAISGDWFPDCPDHPEPRWDGSADSKFRPRFVDCEFAAVRDAIAPMKLGLWMTPLSFNPASATYAAHPEWACAPVGHGLAAVNAADPDGGSNEAGIGQWGPDALPHIESRIRAAIEDWGVEYFKFDFLVWIDCADQGDMYEVHDAFVAMLDELQAAYPQVTFQIDETNDYRLFPFESVPRGPSWFQNGSPPPDRLLHNLWNLSPYVPAFSLGQHALGGRAYESHPVDTLMAAALPSHITFFSDLRSIPTSVVDGTRPWLDFYARYRDLFAQMTYPLLADPLEGGWTALQPWDPEQGRGALLVFRQGSPDASRSVALRNVPPGRTFDLIEGPTGTVVGTVTSAQLSAGFEVLLPEPNTARVLVIVPAVQELESTTLTYDGDTSVKVGAQATLGATLRDAGGSPIPSQPVTFEFRGQTYSATTGPSGRATAVIRITGPPGDYEVVSTYAGNDTYLPNSDRDIINVTTGAH